MTCMTPRALARGDHRVVEPALLPGDRGGERGGDAVRRRRPTGRRPRRGAWRWAPGSAPGRRSGRRGRDALRRRGGAGRQLEHGAGQQRAVGSRPFMAAIASTETPELGGQPGQRVARADLVGPCGAGAPAGAGAAVAAVARAVVARGAGGAAPPAPGRRARARPAAARRSPRRWSGPGSSSRARPGCPRTGRCRRRRSGWSGCWPRRSTTASRRAATTCGTAAPAGAARTVAARPAASRCENGSGANWAHVV